MNKDYDVFKHLDEHVTRQRVDLGRNNEHFYPSEASVQFFDEHGDLTTEGACLRAIYFRMTSKGERLPHDARTQWIFRLGSGVEHILVEEFKQMGIWVDNNVKFYNREFNISGEIDVLVREPGDVIVPYECCTPNTLVLAKDYRLYPFKDMIDSDIHEVRDQGSCPVKINNYQISTQNDIEVYRFGSKVDGLEAEFTHNHPIRIAEVKCSRYIANKKRRTYEAVSTSFKNASDVKIGDYLCIPKAQFGYDLGNMDCDYWSLLDPEFQEVTEVKDDFIYRTGRGSCAKPIRNNIVSMPDFYWLLGLYLAEGSCGASAVYFSLHEDEHHLVSEIFRISEELFGLTPRVQHLKDSKTKEPNKGINVVISSSLLRMLFKSIIPGTTVKKTKHLKYGVIDPIDIRHILEGACAGDGCFISEWQRKINTSVPHLAYLYFQLAAQCGYHPNLKKFKQQSQFNSEYIYSVAWTYVPNKKNNIGRLVDGGDFWCYKVKSIQKRLYSGPVYNMECDGSHTYVTGAIATHNCKSFFGYFAESQILGTKRKAGFPKLNQLLQLLIYLNEFRDKFPYGRMIYFERGGGKRISFLVELHDEGGMTFPVVNGEVIRSFTIEDIYKRFATVQEYIEKGEVPPGDYELQFSPEKIVDFAAKGKVGKTVFKKWQDGKLGPHEKIGNWNCSYCNYKNVCTQGK